MGRDPVTVTGNVFPLPGASLRPQGAGPLALACGAGVSGSRLRQQVVPVVVGAGRPRTREKAG